MELTCNIWNYVYTNFTWAGLFSAATAAGTLCLAFIAKQALSSWRAKRKHELARGIFIATDRVAKEMRHARFPYIFIQDFNLSQTDQETQNKYKKSGCSYLSSAMARVEVIHDEIRDFQLLLKTASIEFDKSIEDESAELINLVKPLLISTANIKIFVEDGGNMKDYQDKEHLQTLNIFGIDEANDLFAKKINLAVTKIHTAIKPYLKL